MDRSLLGFSVHGIFQARISEWVAISYSEGPPNPGIKLTSLVFPALEDRLFTSRASWGSQVGICLSMQETQETGVRSLGGEDPLE